MMTLWLPGAYLSGAVPWSYIIGRLVKGIDIRQHGSGNAGATNVFRVVGPVPGIITFVFDFLKGYLPVFLAARTQHPGPLFLIAVGLCAIAGHLWPVFLNFRGGKGVATAAGVFFALLPGPTLIAFVVFSTVLALTRYVSVGSITASLALPVSAVFFGAPALLSSFAALMAAVIIFKHRGNLRNLKAGKERKIGKNESRRS